MNPFFSLTAFGFLGLPSFEAYRPLGNLGFPVKFMWYKGFQEVLAVWVSALAKRNQGTEEVETS